MSRSNSIVKQASILALAGILVRIIGLLYRSPLTAMILDEGNGYYSTAYNIYALVLLISSYSIPTAISKLISEKIALKEYKVIIQIFFYKLFYHPHGCFFFMAFITFSVRIYCRKYFAA